jgi:hypothetical protein
LEVEVTDYAKLSERELDAKCAVFMGFRWFKLKTAEKWILVTPGTAAQMPAGKAHERPTDDTTMALDSCIRKYSTDLNAARELEEEIKRRGLVREYETALLNLASRINSGGTFDYFPAINASARDRAIAFCACMEAENAGR